MKKFFCLYIFLFSNFSQALPGMSEGLLNYSLDKELVSTQARNCVKSVNESGVFSLIKNVNDINCNSKTTPEDFCKCIEIVSPNGLALNNKNKKEVERVLDETLRGFVYSQMKKQIMGIPNFVELGNALQDTNFKSKCFAPEDNSLIDRLSALGNVSGASQDIQFKTKLLNDVRRALVPEGQFVKIDLLNQFGHYISLNAVGNKPLRMIVDKRIVNEDIDWSIFNDNGILELISKMDNREAIVYDVLSVEGRVQTLLSPENAMSKLSFKTPFQNKFENSSDFEYVDDMVGKLSAGIGKEVINSACEGVNDKVNSILDIDVSEAVENMKYSILNPLDKEDFEKISLVEKLLAKNIKEKNLNSSITVEQHKTLFNVDKLYCLEREKLGTLLETKEMVDKLDIASKDLEIIRLDVSSSLSKMNDDKKEITKLEKTILAHKSKKLSIEMSHKILNDLADGDYHVVRDGDTYIDLTNSDLIKDLERCSEDFCFKLRYEGSDGSLHVDKLSTVLNTFYENDRPVELLTLKRDLKELAIRLDSKRISYDAHKFTYNKSKDKEAELLTDLRVKYGEMAVSRVVGSAERNLKANTNYSSYSSITEAPKRGRSLRIKGRQIAAEVIKDFKEQKEELHVVSNYKAVEKVKVETNDEAGVFDSKKEASTSDFLGFMNNGKAKSPTMKIPLKTIKNTNPNKKRITELENSLASLNAIVERSSLQEEDSEVADQLKIAELTNQIDIQKINNEKIAIQNEIGRLKKSQPINKVVPLPAVAQRVSVASKRISRAPSRSNVSSVINNRSSSSNTVTRSANTVGSSSGPVDVSPASNQVAPGRSDQSSGERDQGASVFLSSSTEDYSGIKLSKNVQFEASNDSRLVKIDFEIDSMDESEKGEMLKMLFLEGEENLIIELPDGEKVFVENTLSKSIKSQKANIAITPKLKRNTERMKYKDLKELLKVGALDSE